VKLKIIACDVLYREVCHAIAHSSHASDVTFVPFGLHDTPSVLRERLQEETDRAGEGDFDAVLLAYALCSRGTADLVARRIPLVLPRAHDCITLLLGSRARYSEEFGAHPGTYYYSAGWLEHRKDGEVRQGYISETEESETDARFREYCEKYGEDNARYLMEQEAQWMAHYNRIAFIDIGLGDVESYRKTASGLAQDRGWQFAEIPGDRRLIDRLIAGDWDDDFLVVQPGQRVVEAFDERIVNTAGDVMSDE